MNKSIDKGKYYRYLYDNMKDMKYIYESVINSFKKGIKNLDEEEFDLSLEWVLSDLGFDAE